jgi:hypothetical protein
MSRRIEMNPGEMFMVADPTILVAEYESVLGDVSKIGSNDSRIAYFFTFTGKVNNKDEQATLTVAMDPMDAWRLTDDVLRGLELLAAAQKRGQS